MRHRHNHAQRWLGALAAILGIAGCELVAGLSDIAFTGSTTTSSANGGGGAGGSGAAGAAGGMACEEPSDCPPVETACQEPVCAAGQCAVDNTAEIRCEDGGTCDGNGRCIGKANGAACAEFIDCQTGHCVGGTCASGVAWGYAFGAENAEFASAAAADSQDNVIVVGAAGPDDSMLNFGTGIDTNGATFIVKLDPLGVAVWADRLAGPGYGEMQSVAVDALDQVVVAGIFDTYIAFPGGSSVYSGGDGWNDIFVGKVDSAWSDVVWLPRMFQTTTGPGATVAQAATHRDLEDVALAGTFGGTDLAFDNGVLPEFGLQDIYAAKLDAQGDSIWSRTFGSGNDDFGTAVAMDSSGNLYVAGHSPVGSVDFGPPCGVIVPRPFLVKLDAATGDCVWAKSGDAPQLSSPKLAVGPDDSVVMVGAFDGTLNIEGSNLTSLGESAYWMRFSAAGALLESDQFGGGPGAAFATPTSVAVDSAGDVAISGVFGGTITFGGWALTTALSDSDAFVLKLSAAGVHLWSKRFGSSGPQSAAGVAVDASDNVLAVGSLSGEVLDFGGFDLTAAAQTDIFVLKLSP